MCSSLWCDPALAFELSWLWDTDDKFVREIVFPGILLLLPLFTELGFPGSSATITYDMQELDQFTVSVTILLTKA